MSVHYSLQHLCGAHRPAIIHLFITRVTSFPLYMSCGTPTL